MIFLMVLAGWVISLCAHEFAHALVAYLGGDTSVRDKGCLTFNPLRYTHPVYSLLMPLLFLFLGGIGLPGGAVYINRARLRTRWWASAVSAAGPLANLLLLAPLVVWLRHAPMDGGPVGLALAFLAYLELSAVLLNLIPVPPLDGYGIIEPFLSRSIQQRMREASRWTLWVVFLALWYVPLINDAFWSVVDRAADASGIPVGPALAGMRAFMFWQR